MSASIPPNAPPELPPSPGPELPPTPADVPVPDPEPIAPPPGPDEVPAPDQASLCRRLSNHRPRSPEAARLEHEVHGRCTRRVVATASAKPLVM